MSHKQFGLPDLDSTPADEKGLEIVIYFRLRVQVGDSTYSSSSSLVLSHKHLAYPIRVFRSKCKICRTTESRCARSSGPSAFVCTQQRDASSTHSMSNGIGTTNVTTKKYSSKDEAVSLLKEQLIKPVKYKQSIIAIADDIDMAIEFGQGVVLKGLNRRIAKDITTLNISDMSTLAKVKEELCS